MTTHKARWIKRDDRSWMRHDIAPPEKEGSKATAWIVGGVFVLLAITFVAWGTIAGDSKRGTPPAREVWVVSND